MMRESGINSDMLSARTPMKTCMEAQYPFMMDEFFLKEEMQRRLDDGKR
jgi:hypothetical protein